MQIKKLTPKFLAIFTLLCLLLSAGSAQTTAVDIDLTPCKDGCAGYFTHPRIFGLIPG